MNYSKGFVETAVSLAENFSTPIVYEKSTGTFSSFF